jgi:predicted Zn-dependent protease
MRRAWFLLAVLFLAGCATQGQTGASEGGGKTSWMPNVPFVGAKGDKTTLISDLKPGAYEVSSLAIGEQKDLAQRRAEGLGFVRTAALEQYLGSIRTQLLANSGVTGVPGRVTILANPAFAASSTPDGNVYIAMGWFKHMETADEVAAILAHEVAHVLLTHHSSDIVAEIQHRGHALHEMAIGAKTSASKSKTVSKGDARGLTQGQLIADATDKLILPAWNRRQEREADLLAVDLLVRADYSPVAMVTMLEKLKAWEDVHREADDGFWKQLGETARTNTGQAVNMAYQKALSAVSMSHPKTGERIDDVAQYIDRHYGDKNMPEPRAEAWKTVVRRPDVAEVIRNYEAAFQARKALDAKKPAKTAATGRTATDAYPNWVLARAAGSLGRQPEAVAALQRAISSTDPVSQIYDELIDVHEQAGNVGIALGWTDKASEAFAGAPRWRPVKIRLLRKAGRAAEAEVLTADCSVSTPDWRRLCQEANQTAAIGQTSPAPSVAPKPTSPAPAPAVTAPKPTSPVTTPSRRR